jgi:hypothetical protein
MKKLIFLFGFLPALPRYGQPEAKTLLSNILTAINKGGQDLKYAYASGVN